MPALILGPLLRYTGSTPATVWVETDGTVYWAVAENLVPTHTDGANRNDNKYIDNSKT